MIKSQFFFINNSLLEIIYSLFKIPKKSESIKKLKKLVSSKNIILTNFGRTAFYFILKFLKKKKTLKKRSSSM